MERVVCGRKLRSEGLQAAGGEGWLGEGCVEVKTTVSEGPEVCESEHRAWEACESNSIPVPTSDQAAYQRHEIMGVGPTFRSRRPAALLLEMMVAIFVGWCFS